MASDAGYPDENVRVLQRREVARVLARCSRPEGPPDDLLAAGLGKSVDEEDTSGREALSESPCDEVGKLGRKLLARFVSRYQRAEAPRHLTFDLVRNAGYARFHDGWVLDQDRFDLRGTDALAGDVEGVVGAPVQEPVAVGVDKRPVSVCPDAG